MVLIELGAIFLGLAVIHRVAYRLGFSPIPFTILAGLAFGEGGIAPLHLSAPFMEVTAEIGSLLLLFALGLEYSGRELREALRMHFPDLLVDGALNFLPGLALALALGWGLPLALWMGAATWITSSGILAHLIAERGWTGHPEARVAVTLSILEDLALALLLPLAGVWLFRPHEVGIVAFALALGMPLAALGIALGLGPALNRAVDHEEDSILLLSLFSLVLLAGGVATALGLPPPISAFLLGIAVSDPVQSRARRLIDPLRDLSAALFFFTLGLRLDPGRLPPVLPLAAGLAIATAFTKMLTGWWAARRAGLGRWARWRAGALGIARGELSGVITGIVERVAPASPFVPFAAAYVLLSALAGPLVVRAMSVADPDGPGVYADR